MAPSATLYDPSQYNAEHNGRTVDGSLTVNKQNLSILKYPEFLPTWNPNQKFPALEYFDHVDKGIYGDKEFANILSKVTLEYANRRITPKFGTEIRGIQLLALDDAGKNDLARLVAERGVVVFRDQDFTLKGPKFAKEYVEYFGPLHIHPTLGTPEGFPELHVTFRGASKLELEKAFATRNNNIGWHSDVSYELNPPATTFFAVIQGPELGGDTIFADTVEAYKRLSPTMQKMIEGLHVLHTLADQAHANQSAGGVSRRAAVSNIHPLVRQHPVTGEKYLYLNREFGRRIVELKQEELENLLEFLFRHVELAHDLQLRASWEPNTVVLWDNRRTVHSAVIDWDTPVVRHAFRISPQGERPVDDLKHLNDRFYLQQKYGHIDDLLN